MARGAVGEDLLLLRLAGLRPVVVHGEASRVPRALAEAGGTAEWGDGLQVRDAGGERIVFTGSAGQRIIAALDRVGLRGVGLAGPDRRFGRAEDPASGMEREGRRRIDGIPASVMRRLESSNCIPLVSPAGRGYAGRSIDVEADLLAVELARALRAERLVFVGDVRGLLEGKRVVSELTSRELEDRLETGEITDGLRGPLECAHRALAGGVQSVHLVDGRAAHSVIAELFSGGGVGTLIRKA